MHVLSMERRVAVVEHLTDGAGALARLRLDDASTLVVAQIAASFPKTDATVHHLPKKDEEP